ncbi:hypothetical protein LTR78_001516 [Recurvomyces mirabilis]|uniref:Peroxin/Ferlin domain-containing protein n=1 Tax=Recurvomyces mirabilis TaxID=574656 RepID=A0AAE1C5Q1_9PEZI|nr:hypothetical protein LTR78_001516 [Recurvomyces mirabilis]KAK5161495.1 hypothetical protein LTS14_001291 [Recurvomyces mirabilis]
MSGPSSILSPLLLDTPNADKIKSEHNIKLVDTTRPAAAEEQIDRDAERRDSTSTTANDQPTPLSPLFKRMTNNSLSLQTSVRQQIAKQKYARYGKDRYTDETDPSSAKATGGDDETTNTGEEVEAAQPGYVGRGKAKAKGLLKRRKTLRRGGEQEDTVIDILYENQRGWFLFGTPRYSAATLLPSDPRPWQNAQFRTSPVSILNAQLPDPSWEWVWKTWYVDMSRDVDEEGWEYSLLFRQEFNWHGNHPWFHSFVRRRRWLRLRRRKNTLHSATEKSHELTPEYFTIHPKTLKSGSDGYGSGVQSPTRTPRRGKEVDVEKMEVTDIASLAHALRVASVDREKLTAVRKFISNGGDELFYLSDRMEEIMALFVYQSSRRQLLAELISYHDSAHSTQNSLSSHDHKGDDKKVEQHGEAIKRAENLHRAVRAADEQVKRLEYWSDIKEMAKQEQLLDSSQFKDAAAEGHPESSFQNKQGAHEGAPSLHPHPEHSGRGKVPKKEDSKYFDAPSTPTASGLLSPPSLRKISAGRSNESSNDSDSVDRYTTADESAHEDEDLERRKVKTVLSPAQKGKEKAEKLSSLDGLMDEGAEEADVEARETYLTEIGCEKPDVHEHEGYVRNEVDEGASTAGAEKEEGRGGVNDGADDERGGEEELAKAVPPQPKNQGIEVVAPKPALEPEAGAGAAEVGAEAGDAQQQQQQGRQRRAAHFIGDIDEDEHDINASLDRNGSGNESGGEANADFQGGVPSIKTRARTKSSDSVAETKKRMKKLNWIDNAFG